MPIKQQVKLVKLNCRLHIEFLVDYTESIKRYRGHKTKIDV